jgi:hypothetical protein
MSLNPEELQTDQFVKQIKVKRGRSSKPSNHSSSCNMHFVIFLFLSCLFFFSLPCACAGNLFHIFAICVPRMLNNTTTPSSVTVSPSSDTVIPLSRRLSSATDIRKADTPKQCGSESRNPSTSQTKQKTQTESNQQKLPRALRRRLGAGIRPLRAPSRCEKTRAPPAVVAPPFAKTQLQNKNTNNNLPPCARLQSALRWASLRARRVPRSQRCASSA